MAVLFRPKRPDQFGAMAGVGHGPTLLSTEASGRCRFSQATFVGAHGNGRDAPIPAVCGPKIEPRESTQLRHWPHASGASAT